MITKNESDKLRHSLSAIKEAFSAADMPEIVVLDTGSSDSSIEVAKEFTDRVFSYEWKDDFASAKNTAIDHATNDSVMILDTDEYITEADINSILGFFSGGKKNSLGLIKRINHFFTNGEERTGSEYIPRIFSRREFCYEGKIHEQLVPLTDSPVVRQRVSLTIDHDGYNLSEEDIRKKADRNIALLEKEEKTPYILYQLGKSYYYKGDFNTAAERFSEALAFDLDEHLEYVIDMVVSYGYSLINSGREEEALNLSGVYETFKDDADYLFVMGLIYMKNALFEEAVSCFLDASKKNEARIEGVTSYLSFYNIGVIFECLSMFKEAAQYYERSGDYAPSKERLKALSKRKKTALFLPYKSAMWDSLESVYLEIKKDDSFNTIVSSIPYFSVDPGTGEAKECVDTDYPSDVLLTDIKELNIPALRPDVIFIHNPYDGANKVTSVHPDYYSDKLKEYTDELIYIPYFASPNGMTADYSMLPAYKNADHWIVTSDAFKESAKSSPYYEKMIPLGSPKYDRVIRLCKEKGNRSPKKRIMICVTLSTVLSDSKRYIESMKNLLSYMCSRDDVETVLRPHPLLLSTLRTLKSEDFSVWDSLIKEYEKKDNFVLDLTPDISEAVSNCDGEIDDGSSVRSLFMIAKKPAKLSYFAGETIDDIKDFTDRVVSDNADEIVETNYNAISVWAANPDGTCGKKIFEWVKSIL